MNLSATHGSSVEPLSHCADCRASLVDIARTQFRFRATLCPRHRAASDAIRIGVDFAGRRTSQIAAQTAEGAFEAVIDIDYLTERLNGAQLFIESATGDDLPATALSFSPGDLFTSLQIDDVEAARALVRRRRSRKHGFPAQVVASYQAYLYGREAGQLEVMAFSLCSIGWRAIQRERGLEPGALSWIRQSVDGLIDALRAEPDEYARWMPSLCTMASQLALSLGDADEALRYADAVLAEPDLLERCPITAYNIVLNLCLATYVRNWRDLEDQLDFAMVWESLFKRIVAVMDIRFGTMYEFKVIYEVMFMVTRLTLIRRGQSDPRLLPVAVDEFIEKVFRVKTGRVHRQRIIACLGVADDAIDAPAALAVPA